MTAPQDLIWDGRDEANYKRAKIRRAIAESELTFARVQGMRIAIEADPPRAATGGFPYPARTCAEWKTPHSPKPERGSRHKAATLRNAIAKAHA